MPLIASMNRGLAVLPPAANDAIALVSSSGVTSPEPSAIEMWRGSSCSMPIRVASSATTSGVISCVTLIEIVLIDLASA